MLGTVWNSVCVVSMSSQSSDGPYGSNHENEHSTDEVPRCHSSSEYAGRR